ncbi:MAG: tetratricopeptide repeat protein [Endomicrobiales bacterium]|nr:tetratricopeptide repeat protein [Endomicrobiales bacterium]
MKKLIFWGFIVFAVVFLTYLGSLKNDFVADDYHLIINNDFIPVWSNVKILLNKDFLKHSFQIESGARPLTLLSLMVDYKIWGKKPFGYHLVNVLLHGVNSVLIFILAIYLGAKLTGKSNYIFGVFSALLFSLHPLQAEVVNVASFRADLLVTFFYVLSIIFFIKADKRIKWQSIIFYSMSVASFVFALFSKEIAVTLPLVILLYLWLYKREEFSKLNYAFIAGLLFLSGTFLLYFWAKRFGYDLHRLIFVNIKNNVSPISSFSAYLNTVFLAFFHYFKKIVWPFNLSFDYLITLPSTVFNLMAFFAIVLLCFFGVLFFGNEIIMKKAGITSGRKRLLQFGIGFAFIAYLPVSNVLPLANTVADRYMYLPLAGVSLILSSLLYAVPEKRIRGISLSFLFALLIIFSYSIITVKRNIVFRNMRSLYTDALKSSPESPRVRFNLALVYMSEKKWNEAIAEFNKVEELNPLYERINVWNNIGICYEKLGDFKKAKDFYGKVIIVNPNKDALNSFADILWKEGNHKGTAWLLHKSVEMFPDSEAYNNLGTFYASKKEFKKAIEYYEQAVNLKPSYVQAWINLINAYENSGRKDIAEQKTNLMAEIFARNKWHVYGRDVYEK